MARENSIAVAFFLLEFTMTYECLFVCLFVGVCLLAFVVVRPIVVLCKQFVFRLLFFYPA